MNLDEEQRKKVTQWVEQGLKLSEIQSRLASELGVSMRYMDVRLLVDDLKLTPKDSERAKAIQSPLAAPAATTAPKGAPGGKPAVAAQKREEPAGAAAGGISLSVDQIARPGAVVSGKVTFRDGNTADWYVDQMGRLGLVPQQAGYRPPAAEVQEFQMALESELSKSGF